MYIFRSIITLFLAIKKVKKEKLTDGNNFFYFKNSVKFVRTIFTLGHLL